jgi:hypothetical protein
MSAHISADHFGDSGAVIWGVLSDPLEGVQSADTYIYRVRMAQLFDSLRVAVGELPFPSDLQLPGGEVDAKQQDGPTESLQQCGSYIVLKLQPAVFKFVPFSRILYVAQ